MNCTDEIHQHQISFVNNYPYNQGILPSSRRNLLPTRFEIKAKHMPYAQGYFIKWTEKKECHGNFIFFIFICCCCCYCCCSCRSSAVVTETVVECVFLCVHTSIGICSKGSEYFYEPIKTLHSTTSVCGWICSGSIVYRFLVFRPVSFCIAFVYGFILW